MRGRARAGAWADRPRNGAWGRAACMVGWGWCSLERHMVPDMGCTLSGERVAQGGQPGQGRERGRQSGLSLGEGVKVIGFPFYYYFSFFF